MFTLQSKICSVVLSEIREVDKINEISKIDDIGEMCKISEIDETGEICKFSQIGDIREIGEINEISEKEISVKLAKSAQSVKPMNSAK